MSTPVAAPVAPGVASRPYVRLAPPYQPPYDDERVASGGPPGNQQLPFDLRSVSPSPEGRPVAERDGLPDPAPWARQFVQAALEGLAGRRPVAQLQAMVTPGVLAGISRVAARAAAAGSQPVIVVRSVRVSEPADRVAEVSAVISRREPEGVRYRAVAARLEAHRGQWRCVTLQVG